MVSLLHLKICGPVPEPSSTEFKFGMHTWIMRLGQGLHLILLVWEVRLDHVTWARHQVPRYPVLLLWEVRCMDGRFL